VIGLTVLGATGTIGMNTLDVVARNSTRYKIVALTANTDVEAMFKLCEHWRPRCAVMSDPDSASQLAARLAPVQPDLKVLAGVDGLVEVARAEEVDYVMAAIVGAAGLLPTLAAARAGKRIMLANKEALVMSGQLFMDAVKTNNAELLPIDSEHNAIFQCLPPNYTSGLAAAGVRRILLTGSGGPFRNRALTELHDVTPAEACAHPNWVMGRKISVDSATMMNKGLEIIEACWLFATTTDKIQVVIHPQSVIHSMVEYDDGSVLAQLGNPDMRTPIAHALAWPERIESGVASLNLFDVGRLDFEPPNMERFPCLRLAREAMATGGVATAILNAANEIAVDAFLAGRLRFPAIPQVIERTLAEVRNQPAVSVDAILAADHVAREVARAAVLTGGIR
jgi:1-deoxy-D-xylulose-5-phosphate reductoisomerase